jgi:hypothetical protein
VVLTGLSALSHFWYIMIAISIGLVFAGIAILLSRVFLRAGREMLAHLLNPAHRKNAGLESDVSVRVARGA